MEKHEIIIKYDHINVSVENKKANEEIIKALDIMGSDRNKKIRPMPSDCFLVNLQKEPVYIFEIKGGI